MTTNPTYSPDHSSSLPDPNSAEGLALRAQTEDEVGVSTTTAEGDLIDAPLDNDEGALGSCGCIDYHMADCPIRTGGYDTSLDRYSDPDYDPYYDDLDY